MQSWCFVFIQEVSWEEWLDNLVSRKRKLGQLDDKIAQLEIEFELLDKEERELLKQQQSWNLPVVAFSVQLGCIVCVDSNGSL